MGSVGGVAEAPVPDNRQLRRAIEFVVAVVEQGQKQRPPLAYPAELRPYLRSARIPSSALGKLRRAIEGDPAFRAKLGTAAIPELVDPIGIEWLRRENGWEQRVRELIAEADDADAAASADQALRRAERRREAAEQAAVRSRAEIAALAGRVAELEQRLAELRPAIDEALAEAATARLEAAGARTETRHAKDRADAARDRSAAVEAERDAADRRAADAEAQRDALLAERAERAGGAISSAEVVELRGIERHARELADRLAGLVHVEGRAEPARRAPLALPGGVARDSRRAAEHLVGHAGALVIVDGYNVAKLGWPELELEVMRERLLDAVDDLARRSATEVAVIFDGADVVGAHAVRRRLARVGYSPAGVSADDVIRAEVAAVPVVRPVVVVTSDAEIRRDVAAAGANVVTNAQFLELLRR
jgi:predicted RNA-binding protein with PIN domain